MTTIVYDGKTLIADRMVSRQVSDSSHDCEIGPCKITTHENLTFRGEQVAAIARTGPRSITSRLQQTTSTVFEDALNAAMDAKYDKPFDAGWVVIMHDGACHVFVMKVERTGEEMLKNSLWSQTLVPSSILVAGSGLSGVYRHIEDETKESVLDLAYKQLDTPALDVFTYCAMGDPLSSLCHDSYDLSTGVIQYCESIDLVDVNHRAARIHGLLYQIKKRTAVKDPG